MGSLPFDHKHLPQKILPAIYDNFQRLSDHDPVILSAIAHVHAD